MFNEIGSWKIFALCNSILPTKKSFKFKFAVDDDILELLLLLNETQPQKFQIIKHFRTRGPLSN